MATPENVQIQRILTAIHRQFKKQAVVKQAVQMITLHPKKDQQSKYR